MYVLNLSNVRHTLLCPRRLNVSRLYSDKRVSESIFGIVILKVCLISYVETRSFSPIINIDWLLNVSNRDNFTPSLHILVMTKTIDFGLNRPQVFPLNPLQWTCVCTVHGFLVFEWFKNFLDIRCPDPMFWKVGEFWRSRLSTDIDVWTTSPNI